MANINKAVIPVKDPITVGVNAVKAGSKLVSSGANAAKSTVSSVIGSGKSLTATLFTPIRIWYFFLIALFITAIVFAVLGIKNAYKSNSTLSTPENIAIIKAVQMNALEKRWIGLKQTKTGLENVASQIPSDQQLLINFSVLSTRLTGFFGPFVSGVFNEDDAVRTSLSTGSRCLIIEIGRLTDSYEPILIYRDSWGIKSSLNLGNINAVARAIARHSFNPSSGIPPATASDPLFVVVYFSDAPDPVKLPLENVRFMAKVAEQLQPLANLIIGQTPQGDFRRQGMESQMFFINTRLFSQKIIILTNADTTPFRRLNALGLGGEIDSKKDLDLLVHARLYSRESPSGLGITGSPLTNIVPAAVITTPNYWLNTPPDRIAQAQSNTKKAWTIVMAPVAYEGVGVVQKDTLKKLLEQYGVQAIPLCIFDTPTTTDLFTGKDAPYENTAWVAKPELIRYIPPKPIAVQKAIPETNSNGGAISSPSF